jgi:hypothetical protein
LENNRAIIVPLDYPIDIIYNMWITQCDKISKISLFLVNDLVDINAMSVNSVNDANNIQIIHKMSINSLISLNELHGIKNKSNTLQILFNDINFVPKLLNRENRNKKLVFIIETSNNEILEGSQIIIKYLIPNDTSEINRFQQTAHEYLVKRLITNYYKINKGFNRIMLQTNNLCTSHFVMNTPQDMAENLNITFNAYIKSYMNIPIDNPPNEPELNPDAEIELPIQEQINNGSIIKNKYILEEIAHDLSYSFNKKFDFDTYVFDAFINIRGKDNDFNQPSGHLQLKNESNLVIESTNEQSIDLEITFCTYDILRIINESAYFHSQFQPIVEQPAEQAPENPQVIPQVIPPMPIITPADVSKPDRIENYSHLALSLLKTYECLPHKGVI